MRRLRDLLSHILQPTIFVAAVAMAAPGLTLSPAQSQEFQRDIPILMTADELQFDDELGIATAKGNVEISQSERVLLADMVTYNQRTDVVTASGNIILMEPTGEVLFAEFAELTDDMREGFLRGFSMLLEDNSRLAAVSAQRRGGVETRLNQAIYSSCRDCVGFDGEPLWNIKAAKVTHNQDRREVVYRDATLEVLGLPVAYTPFLSHPDPTVKRKSGLLTPTFGGSSSLGSSIRLPYFWAISRDKDLTFDPIIYASNYPLITGEYRQSFGDGELKTRLSGIYDTTDSTSKRGRGHIDAEARFVIDDYWRWGSDIKLASDDTYLSRFGFPGRDTLTSRAYLERFGPRSYAAAQGIYFQGLRDNDIQEEIPLVLPKIDYNFVGDPGTAGGYTTLDANFQALGRDTGASSQRLSLTGGWHLPYVSDIGTVTTLNATLQTDLYNVADVSVPSGDTESGFTGRIFPQLSAEWSYPWIRRGETSGMLIEPIAALVLAPNGGNPDRIPNEDSLAVEFDETNLFSANRFPGKDRVEGGSRVVYGLRGGLYGDGGGSSTFMVGQSYQFRENSAFAFGSGLNEQRSDIVGRFTISPNKFLDLLYKTRIDADNLRAKRTEISGSYGPRFLRGDVNYIFFDQTEEFAKREEIRAGLSSDITDQWSARVDTRRDLSDNGGTLSWGASIRYNCDCLDFSINYRRTFTQDRDVPPDESIFVRVVFKTLGEFGTSF
ncbi:MAG: LPS assembly protein LptD [Alphaproteobacteria bacterium]|nr:LPS assembly protein LptD [Alphaproteobacteria bacterium]